MKCTYSDEHNRRLVITDLPVVVQGLDMPDTNHGMKITVEYQAISPGHPCKLSMAIMLDNVILPIIKEALNRANP